MAFLFARDGVEALEVVACHPGMDLALADLNMPRMDGLTLLGRLQEVEDPLATVIVRLPNGDLAEGSFTGDGPVDAFFSAINAATGHDARLKEFHVSAVTGGRDALGEVTVLLELGGFLASGQGVSTDILEASGQAYLRALSNALAADVPDAAPSEHVATP